MYPFDYEADARRACDVLFGGGIAVIPTTVGYVILGATTQAIARIIEAKRRAPAKLNERIGLAASEDQPFSSARAIVKNGRLGTDGTPR